MAGTIDSRLAELGIELPQAAAPAANYVPYAVSGNQVFIAGQVTVWNGEFRFIGRRSVRSSELTTATKRRGSARSTSSPSSRRPAAATSTGLRAASNSAGSSIRRPTSPTNPRSVNGASDLMVEVFGDAGKHARFAVGAPVLPLGVAVEVDAIFEIS